MNLGEMKTPYPGYPLDSISVMPENNKYWLELTEKEKLKNKEASNKDSVIEFIVNNI